jgi:hypothetical protein
MAIIKYRIDAKAGPENLDVGSTWQYEEVYNPLKGGRLLTREQALEIIEEKKLVLVHKTIYGSVWDEPDEPMWQEYNGCFGRKNRFNF